MGIIGRALGDYNHAPLATVSALLLVVTLLMGTVAAFDNTYVATFFETLKAMALAAVGYVGGLFTPKKP